MKVRLKENPREWLKFTAVAGLFVGIMGLALRKRGVLHSPTWAPFVPGVAALLGGVIRPQILRGPYRLAMTISFHFGQVMGFVLLSFFFMVVVTPLGLILRLTGKDLLGLKNRARVSFWRDAKAPSRLDQMF